MHSAYVFDAYGTLFDVHAAVRKHAEAVGPDHAELSNVWRIKQLEFTWTRTMMDRYVDFWDLTKQALDYAFEKFPEANKSDSVLCRSTIVDPYVSGATDVLARELELCASLRVSKLGR